MSERIRVRVYNVRFGDALLVRVPDRDPATGKTTQRHVLIDVGNVLAGDGGQDEVFRTVVEDVLAQLRGRPLDLYVMTHEHLDHAQGLCYAAARHFAEGELKQRLAPQAVWLTASAAPDYATRFPSSRRELFRHAFELIRSHLAATGQDGDPRFQALLANNNPRSTDACVAFLRSLAPAALTHYVHRGFDTAGKHPFKEARFEIWAPEEDSSGYYRKLVPMAVHVRADGREGADVAPGSDVLPQPPPGVDTSAFYDLVAARRGGVLDNLLAIDKAANDTSVVFALDWRGKTLLFAGDAELRSWRKMDEKGVLRRADFLKVSHHGSHNGTPAETLLDRVMQKAGKARSRAVISTWRETYGGIPDLATNAKLRARARLQSVVDDESKSWFDVYVSAGG